MTESKHIRNFCIIAHIDHGKSTLADRLLELTGTVEKRKMKEQFLDTMELERERGITIKLAPVRMRYTHQGKEYELNLIDTPGHVDFSYEVSRSLAAVEGAVLLVDATQGVQAQTMANLTLARAQGLVIIPAVNKIDLPNAAVDEVANSLAVIVGCEPQEVLRVSGKTGQGAEDLLQRIIRDIPAPEGSAARSLQALIFDSFYDSYRGVVAHVRVMEGSLEKGVRARLMGTGVDTEVLEVGQLTPEFRSQSVLTAGEIGYVVTGLKDVGRCRVGDTITTAKRSASAALPGYREVRPYVFAGLFSRDGEAEGLRDAIEKLTLNDASLTYVPQRSSALGFGFRCGFLGLLHLEIVLERLRREYDLDIIATVPSVEYRVMTTKMSAEIAIDEQGYITVDALNRAGALEVKTPQEFPDPSTIEKVYEPWVRLTMITPPAFIGNLIQLVQNIRGEPRNTEYLADGKAVLHYNLPLSSIIVNFYDALKGASQGYASMDYEVVELREADIVLLDILIAGDKAPELSVLIEKSEADRKARSMAELLKETIPRQMFAVKVQAAIGAKIIASETIPAMRKDVTAKLYGGDVTRKMKLLKKQKEGKRRMAQQGSVEIPPEAYRKLLQRT